MTLIQNESSPLIQYQVKGLLSIISLLILKAYHRLYADLYGIRHLMHIYC